MTVLTAMILLLTANGAPILAARWWGKRWDYPLDGGVRFIDGRAWFGSAKTIRGIIASVLMCGVVGVAFGFSLQLGILFGIYAMAGDLLSSFIKRRVDIATSGQAMGLDQIPESLLPLWLLRDEFEFSVGDVLALVAAFFVIELLLSRLLYRWNIRNRPY